jgi:hypothetical protein
MNTSISENPKHNKRRRRQRPLYKKGTRADGARVMRGFTSAQFSRSKYTPHIGKKQLARIT